MQRIIYLWESIKFVGTLIGLVYLVSFLIVLSLGLTSKWIFITTSISILPSWYLWFRRVRPNSSFFIVNNCVKLLELNKSLDDFPQTLTTIFESRPLKVKSDFIGRTKLAFSYTYFLGGLALLITQVYGVSSDNNRSSEIEISELDLTLLIVMSLIYATSPIEPSHYPEIAAKIGHLLQSHPKANSMKEKKLNIGKFHCILADYSPEKFPNKYRIESSQTK